MTDHDEASTLPDERSDESVRRARNLRRIGIVAVWAVVLAGAVGVFGVRSGTARAEAGGYTLDVSYAKVTRAGVAVPWHVRVHHPGGFDGPVTLAVSDDYFDLFDFQQFYPNPSKETGSGGFVYYEFDPPPGDTFEVSLDARTAPDQNVAAKKATTSLVIDGRQVVTVTYRTWVVP